MNRSDELRAKRDAELAQAESYYRHHQNNLEEEREALKSQAEKKQANGENIDAEVEAYNAKGRLQDRNFDNYVKHREKIYSSYESQIQEAEQQEEEERNAEYGM